MTINERSRVTFGQGVVRRTLILMALVLALSLAHGLWAAPPHKMQLEVGVADIDLATGEGRIRRDYRVGDAAAGSCKAATGQRLDQYRECVRLAVAQAHRSCEASARLCVVDIDRFARVVLTRPGFGPRSF